MSKINFRSTLLGAAILVASGQVSRVQAGEAVIDATALTACIPTKNVEPLTLECSDRPESQVSAALSAWTTSPTKYLTLDDTAASEPAESSGETSDADLVKKTLNPVANLISVPFQYNADFGIGPKNSSRSTLNIQPVIPISISKDWNLITRTIVPVIYADSPASGVPTEWGLGDTTASFFFSPKQPIHGWIVGVGPAFLLPTATNDLLGTGKWGAGPTAVLLQQQHGWTYGILANHIWSFAGTSSNPSVNSTFLQPFLTYTFPTLTSIGINTESTYDWSNHQWTIPINLFATQLLKIGKLPVTVQLGGRYYAEGPSGGPEWGVRFVFTFLLPN